MKFREANRNDIFAIVKLIALDKLGKLREDFRDPLPEAYYTGFDNINEDKNQELIVLEDVLTTDKKRPDAQRFYERLGFQASHEGMKLQVKVYLSLNE